MKKYSKIIMLAVVMISSLAVAAQEKEVEMADTMRSNGRIYVVLAVMLTILAGLVLYMIRVDRKVTKLEREN